jgi:hypothetical protein
MTKLPGEFLEPVIKLFVQRHFSVNKRRQSSRRKKGASPSVVVDHGLQLTAVFAPHASTEAKPVGVESLAVEVIDGKRGESRPCMKMLGCMISKSCCCRVQIAVCATARMKCSRGLDMALRTFVWI